MVYDGEIYIPRKDYETDIHFHSILPALYFYFLRGVFASVFVLYFFYFYVYGFESEAFLL
jgi:hypothetical protein